VLKFGGTSVADAERIRGVVSIVRDQGDPRKLAVVVSALGGVTDLLARAAEGDAQSICSEIEARHRQIVEALAPAAERDELLAGIAGELRELAALLEGAALVGECTPRTTDALLSFGERLSSRVVAAALRGAGVEAESCDTRELVVTDDAFGGARVEIDPTYERIRARFADERPLQVVTGFIGATAGGETTTLGRGGSDYTAALVGAALGAEAVELWTDVDGVMSADPRRVASARPVPELGYDELMELSHFGAKVVYPPSLHPVRAGGIPLFIRNTLRPDRPGTRVVAGARATGERSVAGISSIPEVALLRLEGDGMVGVPGIAERLFGSLAGRGISVILITQARSTPRSAASTRSSRSSGARGWSTSWSSSAGWRSSPSSAPACASVPASPAGCSACSATTASTCARSHRARRS
jgi:aspartokinase/homoserine dehydrogenase 1